MRRLLSRRVAFVATFPLALVQSQDISPDSLELGVDARSGQVRAPKGLSRQVEAVAVSCRARRRTHCPQQGAFASASA